MTLEEEETRVDEGEEDVDEEEGEDEEERRGGVVFEEEGGEGERGRLREPTERLKLYNLISTVRFDLVNA